MREVAINKKNTLWILQKNSIMDAFVNRTKRLASQNTQCLEMGPVRQWMPGGRAEVGTSAWDI